jgi:hypothetical protein
MQVVHQVAAAENENTFFPKLRKTLGKFVVEESRTGLINAELHDWKTSTF